MSNIKEAIRVRIHAVCPPVGVTFGVQQGAIGVVDAKQSSGGNLLFEFPLIIADATAQPVRLTGEFAQGPASAGFVYINSGSLAGQVGSCWTRRAKMPLSGVTAECFRQYWRTTRRSPRKCLVAPSVAALPAQA